MSTRSRRELHNTVVHLMLEVTFAQKDRVDDAARTQDLSATGALLLLHLDAPTPMRALARTLRCDASNITGVVDRLATHGLVERVEDPDDRRVRKVALTEEGRRVRGAVDADLVASDPGLDSLDERELADLCALLGRVAGQYRR